MTFIDDVKPREPGLVEKSFVWFLRILSIIFIVLAIDYWFRLVGVFKGDEFRFDTMSVHWKIAAASLAVLQPVTAIGLWLLTAWGAVIWFVTVIAELCMYGWRPDLFGERPYLLIFHGAALLLYVIFRLAIAHNAKKT